jgi:dihydrodipicolinate synthase/N-acetylneuraminate lyase
MVCELIHNYKGEEIAFTKALLSYRGIDCGEPWEPLLPLNEQQLEVMIKIIKEFKINFDELWLCKFMFAIS